MLLAINANNTNTVFAVWDGDAAAGRVARRRPMRAAPPTNMSSGSTICWRSSDLSRDDIDGAIIASVVPEANFNLRRLCRAYCNSEPLIVGEPGVATRRSRRCVDRPEEVGADRLVNTVAAHDALQGAADHRRFRHRHDLRRGRRATAIIAAA